MKKQHNYTVMHWGTWQVESREGDIVAVALLNKSDFG